MQTCGGISTPDGPSGWLALGSTDCLSASPRRIFPFYFSWLSPKHSRVAATGATVQHIS
jgi:hypothetical protein